MIMGHDDYIPVASDDSPGGHAQDAELKRRKSSRYEAAKRTALLLLLTSIAFVLGFSAGRWQGRAGEGLAGSSTRVQQEEDAVTEVEGSGDGLLSPQAFVPDSECGPLGV